MWKPRGAMLALALVAAIVLFAAPATSAATDTVKVYYQNVQNIQVDFPNGKEIQKGDELIIITSSQIYDMERSGIMFYECDKDGVPNMTTSVTPDHSSTSDGNVVTHVFSNLNTDIEMHFTELEFLETQQPIPNGENSGWGIDNGVMTNAVMAVSAALAAVMLVLMINTIRKIDSVSEEQGAA
jgi:hypothetical protein